MIDRTPPYHLEAEELSIGGILLDPNAIQKVANILPPNAYYFKPHRIIYQAALELYSQQQPTDLFFLSTYLSDRHLLDAAGGNLKLTQLVDRTVSAAHIDQYTQVLLDKYQRRQLLEAATQITELAHDGTQPLEEISDQAQQKIFKIFQNRTSGGLIPLHNSLIKAFTQIENLTQGLAIPGIPTDYYDLDAITGGFGKSDLIILAGRPAMGKTSLALNMAQNIAQKHPVAIFSLEMSQEQLATRLLASEANIDANRLRSGRISQAEMEPLAIAMGKLAETRIHINDGATLTIGKMRSEVRKLQSEQNQPLGLIVVDYLQLMEESGDNRVLELSKITRGLKTLAREVNCPILCLSQLNRSVESRNNKRPTLSDLRDSGSIEQDADLVLMLYRDEYYNPDTPDRQIAELIISKHRNGPTGTVKLLFKNELTKFFNLQR